MFPVLQGIIVPSSCHECIFVLMLLGCSSGYTVVQILYISNSYPIFLDESMVLLGSGLGSEKMKMAFPWYRGYTNLITCSNMDHHCL
jgi:hypothetical protein